MDFFCLSRIPPTGGQATAPKAWEDALKSDIRLSDNVGELSSMSPGIASAAAKITQLKPGEFYAFSDPAPKTSHHLVYRSSANPNFLLAVTKDGLTGMDSSKSNDKSTNLLKIALYAAIAAALLTILAALFLERSVQSR